MSIGSIASMLSLAQNTALSSAWDAVPMLFVALLLAIFWGSVGLIGYTYVGYPAILFILSRVASSPVKKGNERRSASLIIAAYNEEQVIAMKLENCLALSYPKEKLEIIV